MLGSNSIRGLADAISVRGDRRHSRGQDCDAEHELLRPQYEEMM